MPEARLIQWCRHQRYTLKTYHGKLMVCPKPDSPRWDYNPIENEHDLLCDALNAGRLLRETPEDSQKIVLQFVEKYGLLGILPDISDLPLQYFTMLDTFYSYDNFFIGSDIQSTQKMLELFFPMGWPELSNNEKSQPYLNGHTDSTSILFLSNASYCEPFDWIVKYFKIIFLFFSKKDADLSMMESPHIIHKVENLDGVATFVTEFVSLKSVIDYLYAKAMTDERKPLRYCKHCGKIFYAKDMRSEFCSPRCRNQFNVYKSRAKH